MTVTGQTNWRQLGDLTIDQFTALIPSGSPMLAESHAIYAAVMGYSALYAAQALHESQWGTTGIAAANPTWHNGLGNKDHDNGGYMRFASWTEGAAWWKQHILTYPDYAETETIADYVSIYAPASDGNDEARYVEVICEIANKVAPAQPAGGSTVADKLVFHRVAWPGSIDRQAQTANKPEGIGWDNLGRRVPKFTVLHRMQGSLNGTDGYFANPAVGALTDYGMGVAAQDGPALSRIIYQWNDPWGYRAGWASGPVSAPWGPGKQLVLKYGINVVNRDGVSLEISGLAGTPIAADEFGEIAKWLAWQWDAMEIPWDVAPINPKTGISAHTTHQMFTLGTGKECAWAIVIDEMDELAVEAKAIMKAAQTGVGAVIPTPTPVPVPKPKYAKPAPIKELAFLGKEDNDTARALVVRDGTKFVYVGDRVRAVRDTHRLQYADKTSHWTGPTIKQGEEFDVMWRFTAKDGTDYYYTPYYTRIVADDCERVGDTPGYASNA